MQQVALLAILVSAGYAVANEDPSTSAGTVTYRSPAYLAISSNGQTVFVTDATAKELVLLDVPTMAPRNSLSLQGGPSRGVCTPCQTRQPSGSFRPNHPNHPYSWFLLERLLIHQTFNPRTQGNYEEQTIKAAHQSAVKNVCANKCVADDQCNDTGNPPM